MPDASQDQPVVLITGSEGLIGRAVARRLADRYHVVGTDRKAPYTGEAEGVVIMDVGDDASVAQGMAEIRQRCNGQPIASVVHLAAFYSFTGEDSPMYESVTVEGTRRLLRALQTFEVEQFLFSSTMLIHASVEPGQHITEESPLKATWAYPASKIKTEALMREERGAIPVVMQRIAGVYTDYGQQPTLVQQIRRIYEKDFESHFFPGNPHTGQSLVHLDDTADAVVRTVERRKELPGEFPVLIGEPDPPTYEQLQDRIGELIHGHDWTTIRVPAALAQVGAWALDKLPGEAFIKPFMIPLADDHYALDISRARQSLGWEPQHRLMDTLPTIIEHLKRDPAGWYRENDLELPRELQAKEGRP